MPTITLTVTTTEATRYQHAVGRTKALGRDATAQEGKQFLIDKLKVFVLESEREEYLALNIPNPIEPT